MQTTLDVNVISAPVESVSDKFTKMTATVQNVKAQMDVLKQTIKELEKMVKMEQKKLAKAQKDTKEKVDKSEKKKPSGFAAPSLLSDDLCDFFSLERGSKLPRTAVTSKLHDYIKTKKLQCDKDARTINADSALRELLKLGDSDELTYFNMQKYMNQHFNKIEVELPTS